MSDSGEFLDRAKWRETMHELGDTIKESVKMEPYILIVIPQNDGMMLTDTNIVHDEHIAATLRFLAEEFETGMSFNPAEKLDS